MGYRAAANSIFLFLMALLAMPSAALARQEGPNPHKANVGKRITDERKAQAAEARKAATLQYPGAAAAQGATPVTKKKVKKPLHAITTKPPTAQAR